MYVFDYAHRENTNIKEEEEEEEEIS